MLQRVATGLQHLASEVVFVGGAVAELYADDAAATEIRPTIDVDCVIEVSTRLEYYQLEESLRKLGFTNDRTPKAPICRWRFEELIVDIMPTEENILGFTNRWYEAGIAHKQSRQLSEQITISVFTAPYYLASKFEPMNSRGGTDLRFSHDFEDIIYILDNCTDIVEQIKGTHDQEVKEYLGQQCSQLLANPNINECIVTALPYSMAERLEVIKSILEQIADLDSNNQKR